MVTHHTKGLVLRTIRYGETSVIVSIFTELFGLQSYLVNNVRTASKKGSGRGNLLQPPALLDLVVYHHDMKNLQRIREFRISHLYEHIFQDVFKNAVSMFMIELLQRSLKQPEPNPDLFHFVEDSFIHLDKANEGETANYPLFFALQLSGFYGFRISSGWTSSRSILDLQEGEFVAEVPGHLYYLDLAHGVLLADLMKVMHPSELGQIRLNQESRRILLHAMETFYALHIQDFGKMKSLPVLEAVLS